jgi:hypothetical protein
MFKGIFVDEGQTVRKPESQVNVTIRWLDSAQVHIATATPIWNSDADVRGYLAVLQTPDNEAAARDLIHALKTPAGAPASPNPYLPEELEKSRQQNNGMLPRNHLRALMSLSAYDKWVKGSDIDTRASATELIFEQCMVRHTYASSYPPGNPQHSIGRNLPKCFKYTIELALPKDMWNVYQNYAHYHRQRLIMSLNSNPGQRGQLGINRNAVRMLTMGSTWPLVMLVGIPKKSSSISSQVEDLEAYRVEHIARVRENARNAIIAKMKRDVQEGTLEEWPEWPQKPVIADHLLPSEPSPSTPILRRLQYIALCAACLAVLALPRSIC